MRIEHHTKLDGINGLQLMVARAIVELTMAGNHPMNSFYPYAWEEALVLRKAAGEPLAGVLLFRHDEANRSMWVSLSYIDPEHRRKGWYKALYDELVIIANKRRCASIASGIDDGNGRMKKLAMDRGAEMQHFRTYTHRLPGAADVVKEWA